VLFGITVHISCCRLEMEIEPIFASVALYNIKERKKVSENFYFDMTSEPVKKMLEPHVPFQDVSSLSRSCIFQLTPPSCDVFLVIRVTRLLLALWQLTLDFLFNRICTNFILIVLILYAVCVKNE